MGVAESHFCFSTSSQCAKARQRATGKSHEAIEEAVCRKREAVGSSSQKASLNSNFAFCLSFSEALPLETGNWFLPTAYIPGPGSRLGKAGPAGEFEGGSTW